MHAAAGLQDTQKHVYAVEMYVLINPSRARPH